MNGFFSKPTKFFRRIQGVSRILYLSLTIIAPSRSEAIVCHGWADWPDRPIPAMDGGAVRVELGLQFYPLGGIPEAAQITVESDEGRPAHTVRVFQGDAGFHLEIPGGRGYSNYSAPFVFPQIPPGSRRSQADPYRLPDTQMPVYRDNGVLFADFWCFESH